MKNYVKPIAQVNEELAEGVYAASGDEIDSDCYTVTGRITQKPETGRENYCIQVDGTHAAKDKHHSATQVLYISFNQPVNFVSCNGQGATLTGGDGSATLVITYNYHNNGNDNIGLGDLYVTSADGLAVTGAKLTCDHQCAYNHPIN